MNTARGMIGFGMTLENTMGNTSYRCTIASFVKFDNLARMSVIKPLFGMNIGARNHNWREERLAT
jgi:hypothetical protein